MKCMMIACETIRDEINLAETETGVKHETIWIESGLHNTVDKLRARLQEAFDAVTGYDTVLLAFGQCGNAALDLKTGDFELIIPRVDDCISLLLGSTKARVEISGEGTYFMTPGWLRGERNIWAEYEYAENKYGEDVAKSIMATMLSNYRYLGLLDTKSFDVSEYIPQTERIADKLELEHRVIPASVSYIQELLTGPWDDIRYLRVPPNTVISDFTLIT